MKTITKQKTFPCNPYYLRDFWSKEMIELFEKRINSIIKTFANGNKVKWEVKEKLIRNPRTRKVVRREAVLTIKWKEEVK